MLIVVEQAKDGLCLLAVQKVQGYCYDPVCLSVCLYQGLLTNCEETEHLTKKVLEIEVVGYHQTNSRVPSAVTLDKNIAGHNKYLPSGTLPPAPACITDN
jgi:hypothetical protein